MFVITQNHTQSNAYFDLKKKERELSHFDGRGIFGSIAKCELN